MKIFDLKSPELEAFFKNRKINIPKLDPREWMALIQEMDCFGPGNYDNDKLLVSAKFITDNLTNLWTYESGSGDTKVILREDDAKLYADVVDMTGSQFHQEKLNKECRDVYTAEDIIVGDIPAAPYTYGTGYLIASFRVKGIVPLTENIWAEYI